MKFSCGCLRMVWTLFFAALTLIISFRVPHTPAQSSTSLLPWFLFRLQKCITHLTLRLILQRTVASNLPQGDPLVWVTLLTCLIVSKIYCPYEFASYSSVVVVGCCCSGIGGAYFTSQIIMYNCFFLLFSAISGHNFFKLFIPTRQ